MPKTFLKTEQKIANLFQNNKFNINGTEYKTINCGKPVCSKGEPKTDVYVLGQGPNKELLELKISVKQKNADFLENKMSAERAEQIFGSDWQNIIKNLISPIATDFTDEKLIFKKKKSRTEEGCITLGWRFEIYNKNGGKRSRKLDKKYCKEVLAGEKLNDDKRNSKVNGQEIKDSGVANMILLNAENITSIQDVISNLLDIDKYIQEQDPELYFVCKAQNLRTKKENKHDGNRPFSVYVEWTVQNGKLTHQIKFDNPLVTKGNCVADKLKNALKTLQIQDTDNISVNNISDPKIINN
jgi:hypothetical protein